MKADKFSNADKQRIGGNVWMHDCVLRRCASVVDCGAVPRRNLRGCAYGSKSTGNTNSLQTSKRESYTQAAFALLE